MTSRHSGAALLRVVVIATSVAAAASSGTPGTLQPAATKERPALVDAFTMLASHIGSGDGRVVSGPSGIDCGLNCAATFPAETAVTLTPSPAAGSIFAGWTGDCSGTGPCQVTMDRARSVTAAFSTGALPLNVVKVGNGTGTVQGSITSRPARVEKASDPSRLATSCFAYQGTFRDISLDPDPLSDMTGKPFRGRVIKLFDRPVLLMSGGNALEVFDMANPLMPQSVGRPVFMSINCSPSNTHCALSEHLFGIAATDDLPYGLLMVHDWGWDVVKIGDGLSTLNPDMLKKGALPYGGVTMPFMWDSAAVFRVGSQVIAVGQGLDADLVNTRDQTIWLYDFSSPPSFDYTTNSQRRIVALPGTSFVGASPAIFYGGSGGRHYILVKGKDDLTLYDVSTVSPTTRPRQVFRLLSTDPAWATVVSASRFAVDAVNGFVFASYYRSDGYGIHTILARVSISPTPSLFELEWDWPSLVPRIPVVGYGAGVLAVGTAEPNVPGQLADPSGLQRYGGLLVMPYESPALPDPDGRWLPISPLQGPQDFLPFSHNNQTYVVRLMNVVGDVVGITNSSECLPRKPLPLYLDNLTPTVGLPVTLWFEGLTLSAGESVTINWGDGTSSQIASGDCRTSPSPVTCSTVHSYVVPGTFTITGQGTIGGIAHSGLTQLTAQPVGIACGTVCTGSYLAGTVITLEAWSDSGSTFTGWGGACDGSNPTCLVTIDRPRTVYAYFQTPPVSTRFHTLTPCRVLDTRETSGPAAAAPALAAGERRVFDVAGKCGVPSTATSVSANITVTGATASGSLRIAPANITASDATAISVAAGRTRANNGMIQLATDGSGRIAVHNDSVGSVHLILDVSGYFQ